MIKISLFSRSKGDQYSFEELLAPHMESLYRLAFRFSGDQHEAEDLVQDLLTKLFTRHNELLHVEDLRPWLARAMHNHYVDSFRRKVRSPISYNLDENSEVSAGNTSNPAYQMATTQLQRHLMAAMESLNDDQRILVMMHDMEAYTLLELSEILETPIGTLKSRLHRARAQLRKTIDVGTFSVGEAC